MITTTEAIVLRGMKFRDTSKIVSLYTRRFGRLSVIAKGARDHKNKFGAALEPMSFVTAVFYRKEGQDLHLLSQCDLMNGFRRMTDDMDRLATGLAVVELVSGVTHDEEANEGLFTLLLSTLIAIDSATKNPSIALYYFEVKLAHVLGFQARFHHCLGCGRLLDERSLDASGSSFLLDRGGCLCDSCRPGHPGGRRMTTMAVRILQRLESLNDADAALRIAVPADVGTELGDMLRLYLRSHVEGLRDSRAERVFSALR